MHAENISAEPRALIIEDEILIAEELRERLSRLGSLRGLRTIAFGNGSVS